MILFLVIYLSLILVILLRFMIIVGNFINYAVYDVFKIKQDDLSPTIQDTNDLRIITLITCDSVNDSFRVVVKAKETF